MNEQKQEQNENETHVENKKNVVHIEQRTHAYHYSTDPDDHYFGVGATGGW